MTGLHIIAGAWKGRRLTAPEGQDTRPTNARARQALFDILAHAPWCTLRGAKVLDVFAGTGAFGLEALSRGASAACFMEQASSALAALRANIAACKAQNCQIIAGDALHPPQGVQQDLVFLDPPYGRELLSPALVALQQQGWIGEGTIMIAELGPQDDTTLPDLLVERTHGKARLKIWQVPGAHSNNG